MFVNDNYGHMAGDEVLKFLTEKINECLRETDTIGRVGGDEFVILIKHIHNEPDIEMKICKIFEGLKTPLIFKQQEPVFASIFKAVKNIFISKVILI